MKHTTTTLAIACILVACGSEDPNEATGTTTSASSTTSAGTGGAGGSMSSAGGAGQGGEATGGGGQGGDGGAPCDLQAQNLLDVSASYETPGLPFELASASVSPLAAVASLPSSPIHHWDFDPSFGSNDVAAVTLELTCHGAGSADLELSVLRGRFQGGGWSYQDEGQAVACGQTASFNINKPPGPEPSYFYRVAFVDGAPVQAVPYTIGTAATYEGPPADCVPPGTIIEPPGDDIPTESGALASQSGTITAPYGNTYDFIDDPALLAPPATTEVVSASLSCSSPHIELHLVTVGDNGQLRFAKRINSNDETIDCGESSPYGIQYHQGQADWFALVTVKETYQPDVDGALEVPYSVVIQ